MPRTSPTIEVIHQNHTTLSTNEAIASPLVGRGAESAPPGAYEATPDPPDRYPGGRGGYGTVAGDARRVVRASGVPHWRQYESVGPATWPYGHVGAAGDGAGSGTPHCGQNAVAVPTAWPWGHPPCAVVTSAPF
jgi:hypothetical protein